MTRRPTTRARRSPAMAAGQTPVCRALRRLTSVFQVLLDCRACGPGRSRKETERGSVFYRR